MGDSQRNDEADKKHEAADAVGKQCVSAQALDSVAALIQWLQERLPSGACGQMGEWGKLPGTKTVANLWLELAQGEISLEDAKPPIRTVHVASIKITDGSGRMLLEAYQEMTDGTIRERNRPLSEKLKLGESVEDACLRGIREELGSGYGSVACVQMMQHSYRREVQQRESFSYPGLMTCYVLHRMVAVMKYLPSHDFITEENELFMNASDEHSLPTCPEERTQPCILERGESTICVKRHYWKWVPEDTPATTS